MKKPWVSLGLAVLAVFFPPTQVMAHRLEGDYQIRSVQRVVVEAWYETSDSARSASVQVYQKDGKLLVEGRTDKRGLFVFTFLRAQPLRIVVDAGAGHRKDMQISAGELEKALAGRLKAISSQLAIAGALKPAALVPTIPGKPSESDAHHHAAKPGGVSENRAATQAGVDSFADRDDSMHWVLVAVGTGLLAALAGVFCLRKKSIRNAKL